MDDNKIVIQSINKKSRVGWESKFTTMSDKKQDKLLIPDSIDLNSKECEWKVNELEKFLINLDPITGHEIKKNIIK